MLLLYRVEAYIITTDSWKTLGVFRPSYKKKETFKTEKWGFLKMRKRTVVTSCNILNEKEAIDAAHKKALACMHKAAHGFREVRIMSTSRRSGVLRHDVSMLQNKES